MSRKHTAAEAYAATDADIDSMIQRLQAARQAHAQRAAQQPGNWGFAGDLQGLRESLQRALEAVGA
jgi:protein-arginine kinase activator protein McsA